MRDGASSEGSDPAVVFRAPVGSALYGTKTENSDEDIGELHIEPLLSVVGVVERSNLTQTIREGVDTRRHYLGDFTRLCLRGNPNTLEWIFCPEGKDHLLSPLFEVIRKNVSTSGVIASHMGFARSQIINYKHPPQKQKRRELYDRYGYDVKAAHHAIRLCMQLKEFLSTGKISFPFSGDNLKVLMDVKTGNVPLVDFEKLYLFHTDEVANTEHDLLDKRIKSNYEEVSIVLASTRRKIWEANAKKSKGPSDGA